MKCAILILIAISALRAIPFQQTISPVPSIKCSDTESAPRGQAGGQNGASRDAFCVPVEGTVVRLPGNSAIANAVVILEIQEGGPFAERLTTRADDNGRFSFPKVNPQYNYNLAVTADGFNYQTSQVTLRSGQRGMQPIRLTPYPTLAGQVETAYAMPLAAALVRAYRIQYTPIGRRLKIAAKGLSNDRGGYRVVSVPPGDYYLSASFNEDSRALPLSNIVLSPNLSNPDGGFVTAYFPNVLSPIDAEAFTVTLTGVRSDHNISLTETGRFTVRVHVYTNSAYPSDPHRYSLALLPLGADLGDVEDYAIKQSASLDFEIRNVGTGRYSLVAFDKSRILSEPLPVNVDQDLEVKIPVYDPVDIPGTIVNEDGDPVISIYPVVSNPDCALTCIVLDKSEQRRAKLRVRLVRTNPELGQTMAADVESGQFNVKDVGPGSYDVYLDGLPQGVYIKEVQLPDSDPNPNWFGRVVIESARPRRLFDPVNQRWRTEANMKIVLATANSIVTGAVWTGQVDRGGPTIVPGALVVAMPDRNFINPYTFREDRFFTTRADGGGNFKLRLPEGIYTFFGFIRIPENLYFDPEFLRKIVNLGFTTKVYPLLNIPSPVEVLQMSRCTGQVQSDTQCVLAVPVDQSAGIAP